MSRRENVEAVLRKAEGLEKKYDWAKAADLYEQTLGAVGKKDLARAGEIQERIAYSLYWAAFQAETQEEFKSHMLEAVEAYERAGEVYEKVEHAKSLHCKAMALYANSWIHVDASRKKEVLDDCGRLLKEAMKAFEEAGDHLGYGKACTDLLFCLDDRSTLEWDWTENRRRLEEATKHGQNAISTLSKVGDERELARAYFIAGLRSLAAGLGYLGEEKREEFIQTALSRTEKALELSKRTGDEYLVAWSNCLAAWTQFLLTGNLELSLRHAEECLQQAKKTKDNFLIGLAFWGLNVAIFWIIFAEEEDPDKKREGYERVMRYAEDAVRHLLIVCRYDHFPTVYFFYSESYRLLADELETDLKERHNLLERSIKVGQEGLEYLEQSRMPGVADVHHGLSKALYSLSKMETQITEKRGASLKKPQNIEKNLLTSRNRQSPPSLTRIVA